MAKKTKISPEDIAIFQKAMEGTKPLAKKKMRVQPSSPVIKPRIRTHPTTEELALSEREVVRKVNSEEFITYRDPSISHKILRKLRKGQYNVDAILDLHGMTVEKAKIAVESFLLECLNNALRVVLIIHGKGHHSGVPILKNKLNHWLRELNVVLAFCSAAPTHGSRGAIYVLLKHTREEDSA